MRAAAFIGVAFLAAVAGYTLSRMQGADPPVIEKPSTGSRNGATDTGEITGDAAVVKATSDVRQSFLADVPNTATMSRSEALPAESMPLAQSAATLGQLMRAGSRDATLRLLRQTQQCELYRQGRKGLDMALGLDEQEQEFRDGKKMSLAVFLTGDKNAKSFAEDMAQGAAKAMAEHDDLCAAFDDSDDSLRFEAQWRAALLGELEGLILFSVSPAMDLQRAIEQGDRIERYRQRALSFMSEAVALHSSQAVAQLMNAHDPGWIPPALRPEQGHTLPPGMRSFLAGSFPPPPLRQVAGKDPVAAYRYAQLCQRVCPDRQRTEAEAVSARLRAELSAADRERAEDEAQRLRDQYFPDAHRADWVEILGEPGDEAGPRGS